MLAQSKSTINSLSYEANISTLMLFFMKINICKLYEPALPTELRWIELLTKWD